MKSQNVAKNCCKKRVHWMSQSACMQLTKFKADIERTLGTIVKYNYKQRTCTHLLKESNQYSRKRFRCTNVALGLVISSLGFLQERQ